MCEGSGKNDSNGDQARSKAAGVAGADHGVPEQRRVRAAVVRRAAALYHDVLSVGAGDIWAAGQEGQREQALAVAAPEFAAAPAITPSGTSGQAIMTLCTGTAEIDIYAGAGEREIETVLRVLKLC